MADNFKAAHPGTDDPLYRMVMHLFRSYRRIGGQPADLLAAIADGMTLKQFLCFPWPLPPYIKSRKRWNWTEAEDLLMRADFIRNTERGERVNLGPFKERAFAMASRYVERVRRQDAKFRAELHLAGGPEKWDPSPLQSVRSRRR